MKIVLVCFALVFCLAPASAQGGAAITVFAAASLTEAFTEIGAAFEAENSGVEVIFNFGSSSTLVAQLGEGAPADVFASANQTQMDAAREAGRIAGKPQTFAKNRLVLIVPTDNPANIHSLHDLAAPGVKLVLAAPGVPIRDYTDSMLDRLAHDEAYGDSYRNAVIANVVSEEGNVRQVSAKVALGEADAGVVYTSDVTPDIAAQVAAVPIPDAFNTLATYPIAVTDNSANPEQAQAFVTLVLSDAGQDILAKWGFIPARIPILPAQITIPTDGALHVGGQVLNPIALTIDQLKTDYASHTVDVTYSSNSAPIHASFTGVTLWDILSSVQVNFDPDVTNDPLSLYVVATGHDGYQVVLSWSEIDPAFAEHPILVAFEENGQPITDGGPLRLVVPGDPHDARYVKNLVDLSVRDAPPAED